MKQVSGMRIRLARAGVPVALVLIALAASACYAGNPAGPRVAVVGDSITWMASGDIGAALGPHYAYETEATPGFTIAQGRAELQTVLNDPQGAPSIAIINLGTNDAEQQNSNWQTDYNNLISEASPIGCVILTTVNTVTDWGRPMQVAENVNAAIRQTVATHPGHFYEVDWSGHARDNPGDVSPVDAVHPTSSGDAAIASLDVAALQQYCG